MPASRSTQFAARQTVQHLVLQARPATIEVKAIPALAKLVGNPKDGLGECCEILSLSRTIFVAANIDATYELLSHWAGIELDAAGSPATYVDVIEIDRETNSKAAIDLLRKHATLVDPNRIATSDEMLTDTILNGELVDVARLFARNKALDPLGYLAISTMFGDLRFSSSTYHRRKAMIEGNDSSSTRGTTHDAEPPEVESTSDAIAEDTSETAHPHIAAMQNQEQQQDLFDGVA